MKTRLTKEEKALVVGLFKDGYSVEDVMGRYGLSRPTVEGAIRQALKKQEKP